LIVTTEVMQVEDERTPVEEEGVTTGTTTTTTLTTTTPTTSPPLKVLYPSHKVHKIVENQGNTIGGPLVPGRPVVPEGTQVRYLQQSVGPYRRIVVELSRTVVVGAGDKLLRLVEYFVRPCKDRQYWSSSSSSSSIPSPVPQPRYMDIEVRMEDSFVGLLEELL